MIIIVVDDEMAALNLLKEEVQVAKPEAQVLSFASSVSALEYINFSTVSIAFLDLELPVIIFIDLAHLLSVLILVQLFYLSPLIELIV